MNPINNQDRPTIILKKHKTAAQVKKETSVGTKKPVNNRHQSEISPPVQQLAKFEKNAEEGNFSLPKVPISLRTEIQRARNAKGWTQQDLAKRLHLPLEIVRGYENGTTVPVGATLAKIKKCLDLK
jgi:putative transcription factor